MPVNGACLVPRAEQPHDSQMVAEVPDRMACSSPAKKVLGSMRARGMMPPRGSMLPAGAPPLPPRLHVPLARRVAGGAAPLPQCIPLVGQPGPAERHKRRYGADYHWQGESIGGRGHTDCEGQDVFLPRELEARGTWKRISAETATVLGASNSHSCKGSISAGTSASCSPACGCVRLLALCHHHRLDDDCRVDGRWGWGSRRGQEDLRRGTQAWAGGARNRH